MKFFIVLLAFLAASLLFTSANLAAGSIPVSAAPLAEMLDAGRIDDVIQAASSRIHSMPQDAQAHNLLARAYFGLHKWDKAIEEAERATALDPSNGSYFLWLGRTYGEKAGEANFMSAISLAKKARQAFERAVQLEPDNLHARSDLTEFYIDAPGFLGGGLDRARQQIEVIAKKDEALADMLRARVAEKEKNYAAAEQQFRAAIAASGNQASYWLNLASYQRRREHYAEMEEAIAKAMQAKIDRPSALYDAAEMLNRTGRSLPKAAELLRQYLAPATPKDEDAPAFRAHYLLGTILEKQGDKQGAASQYAAALALAKEFDPAREAVKRLDR